MRALALLAVLSLLTVASPPSFGQGGEDIVGTWQLDLERSDPRRGENAPPLVDTEIKVSMAGEGVRVVRNFDTREGARVLDVTYETDGKPHEITGPMGNPVVVRARWAKERLRVSYTVSRGGFDLDITETWSVRDDELTILYSTRIGERMDNRKELYVRAAASE
jgi:hypothetical protein